MLLSMSAYCLRKKKKMQSRMNVRNMAFLAVAGARKKSLQRCTIMIGELLARLAKSACGQRTIALSCQTRVARADSYAHAVQFGLFLMNFAALR